MATITNTTLLLVPPYFHQGETGTVHLASLHYREEKHERKET
jgi:hypothetical protein